MFAIIGLILVIIGSVSFVNLGLKKFVFTKSDYPCYNAYIEKTVDGRVLTESEVAEKTEEQTKQCEEQRVSDKQRQASNALAQLIIGLPLYLYHWMVIKKENQV
jgi:hypothetical protein